MADSFADCPRPASNPGRGRILSTPRKTDTPNSDFGFEVAFGATYSLSKNFYVGPLFDLSGVFIDNGWDRYSSYQIQHTRLVIIPAGGIKFGYRTSKTTAIECDVLAGKNGFGCNANLVWNL